MSDDSSSVSAEDTSDDAESVTGSEASSDIDKVEELRDAIDLIASTRHRLFLRAISHLPVRLQDEAFEARNKLDPVACAIVSRRIGSSVQREMKSVHKREDAADGKYYSQAQFLHFYGEEEGARKWAEAALGTSSSASKSKPRWELPQSKIDVLPSELRACIAAAAWCRTLSELPLRFRAKVAETLWHTGDTRALGRLACVSRTEFRNAALLERLREARTMWLNRWLCLEGLPSCCPLPEQGRRVYFSLRLHEAMHTRAAELWPNLRPDIAMERFVRDRGLELCNHGHVGGYVFCLAHADGVVKDETTCEGPQSGLGGGGGVGRSDGAASEAFRVTEYDNVSTGVVFLDCKGEALANVLLEVTGGATRAEDDHYTLGLPRPRAEPRYRRSSDPPPLPLATHALTLRRADEGDLATLTYALPKHGLRLRAADLQRRCTDSRRTSLDFGEVRGDCGIWCPPPHPDDISILRPRVSRGSRR